MSKLSQLPNLLSTKKMFRVLLFLFFAIALFIRLYWVFQVQNPSDVIYSDMKGYIQRASDLTTGNQQGGEKLALYPFGTHYLYALEMWIFGRNNYTAMAIVQAVLGASVVPFMMLAARRCFCSFWGIYLVGLLITLWYPQIVFTGFFSSEVPFMFFLSFSLWLWIRLSQTGRGAFLTGLISILGFTIRPQLIMFIILAIIWCIIRRNNLPRLSWKVAISLLAPILAITTFSFIRHHQITERYHLISDNGTVGTFFASTRYKNITAIGTRKDGSRKAGRFQPSATRQLGYTKGFAFHGYIPNAEILDKERERFLKSLSIFQRLSLVKRNVSLLAFHNTLWPELDQAKFGWRKLFLIIWEKMVQYLLIPFAFFGLMTLILYRNLSFEIVSLHVVTMIYTAAVYFGGIRYRIPYDSILVMLAVQGIMVLLKLETKHEKQTLLVGTGISIALISFMLLVLLPWGYF